MKSVVSKMDNTLNKDSIIFNIAEKENLANVLIGNFASQCMNIAQADNKSEYNEARLGLKISADQLGSFISSLIAENGNLQRTLEKT